MTMRATTSSAVDSVPEQLQEFARRRASEIIGAALVVAVLAVSAALATWSVQDPSLNHAAAGKVRNILGAPGAVAADIIMQLVGLASVALLSVPVFWGLGLMTHRIGGRYALRAATWGAGTAAAAALCALLPTTDRWPLDRKSVV